MHWELRVCAVCASAVATAAKSAPASLPTSAWTTLWRDTFFQASLPSTCKSKFLHTISKIVKFRVTKTITERWLALEDEDDNGGDAEKEEEEDLTDIEFDDEPLEEIYDIF